MALRPGGNRQKGHDGERDIVKLLQPIVELVIGEKALRRNLMQSREGGYDICGLDHLAIEVKRCETLEVEKWWRQTLRQAEDGGGAIPVLMFRQNRGKWRVMMFGHVGAIMCRVEIDMATFGLWLGEDLKMRVRRGEIRALSGFYDGEGVRVGETGGKAL
jgi:Holliday junction resolvase